MNNTDIKILCVLNHQLTDDQIQGLHVLFDGSVTIDVLSNINSSLADNLKNTPANIADCAILADKLLKLTVNYDFIIFPVGSPLFQDVFHQKNMAFGVPRLYSDTARDSIDVPQLDGSIVKKTVFKHRAWIVCT